MSFWYQFDDEKKSNDINHPPLTDDMVRSLEDLYKVRFPKRLVALLKEKNGGYLTDNEFKFDGEDYMVDSISGLTNPEEWSNIKPITRIFEGELGESVLRELNSKFVNPDLVLPFADYAGHCLYALDFNDSSPTGEPRIVYLEIEGDVVVRSLADSFDDFLKGHYLGEPTPSVNLEDVSKETLLVETRSAGRHVHGGTTLEFFSWACDRKKELLVFSKSTWDGKVHLRRSVVPKKSLAPDFCEISKVDYVGEPAIYQLLLHVDPNCSWVELDDAEQSGTVWKNTKGKVVYDRVYSHDRDQLVQLSKRIFPNYRGTPTSLTENLNGLLKNLGIIND